MIVEQQVQVALFSFQGIEGDWKVFNEAACWLNIYLFKKKYVKYNPFFVKNLKWPFPLSGPHTCLLLVNA
jgi:hypothetical protein